MLRRNEGVMAALLEVLQRGRRDLPLAVQRPSTLEPLLSQQHADPLRRATDIPILTQAKAEYAKLQWPAGNRREYRTG